MSHRKPPFVEGWLRPLVNLRLSRVQGPVWVGNARRLGRDCLPWHAVTTQKTIGSSRFRSTFDSSRGDLDILLSTKWPRARPGGCLPPRLSALPRGYFQEDEWENARRSGLAKGRGNRGKIVTRRAEICGPHRTMPPRRSAGSGRDGGRRTWGAGTGGAESSGSGPVQPAHE